MKLNVLVLSVLSLVTSGTFASACPLNKAAAHTEVTVPCVGSRPDYSQAFVNQSDASGGECRVDAPAGEAFVVIGENLALERGTQIVQYVGSLVVNSSADIPSCTEQDGDYYSNWITVQLN